MYRATIAVTLRPSILDPQGKTTQHALHNLGFDEVTEVRIGKHIELTIDANDVDEARHLAEEACERVLANPVMEDYEIALTEPVGRE
jgi:phosphoribosylformylglycinamidine synthase